MEVSEKGVFKLKNGRDTGVTLQIPPVPSALCTSAFRWGDGNTGGIISNCQPKSGKNIRRSLWQPASKHGVCPRELCQPWSEVTCFIIPAVTQRNLLYLG